MSALSDFVGHGYQVIKELGHNLEGGRFTYLAKRLADNVDVVVKQFQFSKGAGWDGFKAIEREIKSLQGLNHRGIPKYLDKFETDNGYCLVTEYFPADTLPVGRGRSFTPDQIKQIAVQLLEILVYLQERMPPVIHRDVKPENILVDGNLNVYLIDFGFARVGSGSVAMSSANAGTFGFMAPEQIRNLKLTNASDLYGLGLTLICLIGNIPSVKIGDYIDFNNRLDRDKINPKLKECSRNFIEWLNRMVAPNPEERYSNAKESLKVLRSLYITRQPEITLDRVNLEFTANRIGEKISQNMTIENSIFDTNLEGNWEVVPHPSDPYPWISIQAQPSKGNRQIYQVVVDTSRLKADQTYLRRIIFHNNSSISSYPVEVRVKTAKIPNQKNIKLNESIIKFVAPMAFSIIATFFLTSWGISASLFVPYSQDNLAAITQATSESVAKYGQAEWNESFVDNQKYNQRQRFIQIRTEELKSKFIDHRSFFSNHFLIGAFFGSFLPILVSLILNLHKKPKRRISGGYLLGFPILSIIFSVIFPSYGYAFWAFSFCPIAAQLSFYIIKNLWDIYKNLWDEDRKFGDSSHGHYENRERGITTFDANLFYFMIGFVFWAGHMVGFLNPFVITGFFGISILVTYKFLLIPIKNRKIIQEYRNKERDLIDP
jgi:serine/threonine protein kinase